MKRRPLFAFFANPYVILADILVSLTFIISLFLLSATVYSEEAARILERDDKRKRMAVALDKQLRLKGLLIDSMKRVDFGKNKYRMGNLLEVEDDGTLQRFRFPSGALNFRPQTAQLQSPVMAAAVLEAFKLSLLANRRDIKSIVIEGQAVLGEPAPWPLAQQRAEAIRLIWDDSSEGTALIDDVRADFSSPIYKWMKEKQLWDFTRFTEWHLQEYAARRMKWRNGGAGVIPASWVIESGRGDSVELGSPLANAGPVVEFKVEYTERSGPPLDDFLVREVAPSQRQEAQQKGLIDLDTLKAANAALSADAGANEHSP